MRLRKIKKYGNTHVIVLNTIDMKDFSLRVGDSVDIDDIVFIKKKNKKLNEDVNKK